jgi:RNA polymerase sigma-70 factor (ECF subfamily)
MDRLQAVLAEDVSVHSDGGGKRLAAYLPIFGIDNVMKLHRSLMRIFGEGQSTLVSYGFINGLPGFVTREADGILQTTALLIVDGQVHAVYVMRNPDKLGHLGEGSVH